MILETTDTVKSQGFIKAVIDYKCGKQEILEFPNTILNTGRNALASGLTNTIGSGFNLYINRMLFGDGGTADGTTKYVSSSRNGLFGITQASKPVISSVDPNVPSQAIFTSVVSFADANGAVLSEMALQLATGDLYSMATFPNLTKTSSMQITWTWRINYI